MPGVQSEHIMGTMAMRTMPDLERSSSFRTTLPGCTKLPARRASQLLRQNSISNIAYLLVIVLLAALTTPADAVLINNFENCLTKAYQDTAALQFTPRFVDVVFNTSNPAHNLRVTVWGNVSGSVTNVTLPAASSDLWSDSGYTDGKIVNYTASTNKLTTLSSKFEFLSYEPWSSETEFCSQIENGTCPLAPVFTGNT